MNLNQLEVFVAIVDTGSLTSAGDVVGLTQSAVSYSLSRLEAELGVTLLERGRQGIALTRVGHEVVQHARAILNHTEAIRQKAARERGLTVGKLRFGCVSTVPSRLLTGILRDFQQKYPDIDVVLFEGTPRELVDWLENGVIDIATVTRPEGFALSIPFVQAEITVIVPANHRLAHETAIPLESLTNETFIGPKAEYGLMHVLLGLGHGALPRLRHEVSTPNTIFAMVREKMGVALVLKMLLDTDTPGIVALPLAPRQFTDIYLASNLKAPAAEAFLESCARWAKAHGFTRDTA